MTDLELLRSYDRSSSKAIAMVRAMYREGVSLGEIVSRLTRLGRKPGQSLWWAFGTEDPGAVPESRLRAYAKKHKIAIVERAAPVQTAKGGVSEYCRRCAYFVKYGERYCDYITVMGKRRGCPAGDGCKKRRLIGREKHEA